MPRILFIYVLHAFGEPCGPTEESLTIPAHKLMLNYCRFLHSILSAITQKCSPKHVDLDIFSCFAMGNSCSKFGRPVRVYIYMHINGLHVC
jgi:hypothetical protein